MKIVLGSQSKQRQEILRRMGYTFDVMSADIDEKAIRLDDPGKLTLALANAKADALIPRIKEPSILITTDLVCVWNRKILEKPENVQEAKDFLHGYAFHPVTTVGAVVVTNTETGKRTEGVDRATVYFRPIPEDIINALIAEGHVFTWAGGFAVEDHLLKEYVERIEGETESVMGLPRTLTLELIKKIAVQSKE